MIGEFNNRNITSLNQPRRKMRCGRRASSRSSGTKISAVSKSPLSQFIGICINGSNCAAEAIPACQVAEVFWRAPSNERERVPRK